MFLTRTALVAACTALVATTAGAAEPALSTEQCIAANEAGQGLRQSGKLAEARAQFAACVADACPGPIREDCAQRLEEATKATPSVVFEVRDAGGDDVAGAVIQVDGKRASSGGGKALEVDPGEHEFVFEASGRRKVTKRLVVVEGVKRRRVGVVLADGSAEPPAPTGRKRPEPMVVELTDDAEENGALGAPPTLAWVAFGVGGAGLVLGAVAGLVAGGKHSTLEETCGPKTCPSSQTDNLDSFHSWRAASTAGYVVGALGVAGGGVLWLAAPKPEADTARIWLGPTSAGVAGRF